jgi:hypothetical protein
MTVESRVSPIFDMMSKTLTGSHQPRRPQSLAAMKLWQSARIREIANALTDSGFRTLDTKANALGVSRSTAWTILRSAHKSSGLSARIINRILARNQLPPLVRAKVLEYVEEKIDGRYGHSKKLRRRFVTALSIKPVEDTAQLRIVKAANNGRLETLRPQHRIPPKSVAGKSGRLHFGGKLPRSRGAL